jgi:esterase/lipase
MKKIHLYFVPGLAASSTIFEFLQFPPNKFELHFLEWLMPLSQNETLENYAKRMANLVSEENPVLIGVSFGGIMVQEMSKYLNVKKIILISSVKTKNELPKRLKIINKTKLYKLLPTKSIANIESFSKFAFGNFAKKRIELYKKYLSVRDEKYLMWAVYNVLNWTQITPLKNTVHFHGTNDQIFPIKHIKNCIPIEKGTHIMVLNKAKTIGKLIVELF